MKASQSSGLKNVSSGDESTAVDLEKSNEVIKTKRCAVEKRGLLCVFCVFWVLFLIAVNIRCFGIIFKLILKTFPQYTNREVASLNSVSSFLLSSLTIIAAPLTDVFSCRCVAIVGGMVLSAGTGSMYFAESITYLYVSSVLIGIGVSCCISSTIMLIPRHFTKWRTLALGIAISGVSVGGIVQCPLLQYMGNLYGFHTAMLIVSGTQALICILGICFMDPKKPPTSQSLSKTTLDSKTKPSEKSTENAPISAKSESSSKTSVEPDKEYELAVAAPGDSVFPITYPVSGIETESRFTRVSRFLHLDFSLLKNGTFIKIIILAIIAALCHPYILIFVPKNATLNGMANQTASYLLSASTAGEFVSRLLGWVYDLRFVSLFNTYFIITSMLATTLMTLPFLKNFLPLATAMFCEGFCAGSLFLLYPILIVEHHGFKAFPSAYGFCRLFQSLMALISPIIGGLIMDLTGNYNLYCWGIAVSCYTVVICLSLSNYVEYRKMRNATGT